MKQPSEFKPGMRVAYIPPHARGNMNHKDVEYGIVSSTNEQSVFVRYFPLVLWFGFKNTTARGSSAQNLIILDDIPGWIIDASRKLYYGDGDPAKFDPLPPMNLPEKPDLGCYASPATHAASRITGGNDAD